MGIPIRDGVLSRVVFSEEGTFDSDSGITTGYVLNLAAQSGFGSAQPRVEAPVFKATRRNYQTILGMISSNGRIPQQVEYLTFGRQLKVAHGANGYARPGAGTTTLHQFYTPTGNDAVPGSCQLASEFVQTTLVCIRNKGVGINQLGMKYATNGVAGFDADYLGIGDEVQTQLVTGGSIVDEGYTAVNYFNGHANLNGVALQGLTGADINLDFRVGRVEAAFQGGKGAGLSHGTISPTGTINLIMSTSGANPENDLNFYNAAINNNAWPIDIAWSNNPEATADQWCRIQMPTCYFERFHPKPGGQGGIQITQRFRAESFNGLDNIAAEYVVPTRAASFNLTGSNNILSVQIDGGAAIPTTLTTGAARTPAQIVADLTANGTFAAVATADVFMGRIRITSKGTGGSTTSVQFAAPANNINATIGADTVSRTGFSNTPYLITLYNTKSTNY